MHLVYYDESGDDGFPAYAAPMFVLSAIYGPAQDWKENFERIARFKRELVRECGLPFDMELHTRELILNKKPYSALRLSGPQRLEIITRYCQMVSRLTIRSITTAVIKTIIRSHTFDVLDRALSYSINRIDRDLGESPQNRFLVITDDGRVAKMRTTTRRMQKFNYVPSQFGGASLRREIHQMIEDPLPKDSKESYFIQLADLVACLFYMRAGLETKAAAFPARTPPELTPEVLQSWLDTLKPILNLSAAPKHPYGLVLIPSP
jgi:hypothetical protein